MIPKDTEEYGRVVGKGANENGVLLERTNVSAHTLQKIHHIGFRVWQLYLPVILGYHSSLVSFISKSSLCILCSQDLREAASRAMRSFKSL